MYASVNQVDIGSDNSLSKFYQNTKPFIHENASENIVCEKVAVWSRGRWVNGVVYEILDELVVQN